MNNITKILIAALVAVFVISFILLSLIRSIHRTRSAIDGSTDGDETTVYDADSGDNSSATDPEEQTTEAETAKPLEVSKDYSAKQIFVYDIGKDSFIYEKGTDMRIRPASTTKLLTALYALNVMPEDTVITVRKEDLSLVASGSSRAFVYPGNQLTVSMLIEGMMLPSGNDAAYALAGGVARFVSGNDDLAGENAILYFVDGLNTYAKKIGCKGTSFTTPDGLAGDDHYTTSDDLALIASLVTQNETIMSYCSTVTDRVMYASKQTMTWKNTNKLIDEESEFYCENVTGLKTGSLTDDYSVIVSAKINDTDYIIGVYGCEDKDERFRIAKELISEIGNQN